MSEHPYHLKCKWAIASHARAIIAVSILIAILTAFVVLTGFVTPASAYSPAVLLAEEEPDPSEITNQIDQTQEVTATVDTSTFAYTAGERLTNVNTYPLTAVNDIRFTASASATEATPIEHRLLLQYEATVNGQENPFWTETETLETRTISDYKSGETIALSSRIDIEEVYTQIQDYDKELGQDASVNVYTIIETDYNYESSESRMSEEEPVLTAETAVHKQEIKFGNNVFTVPTSADSTSVTTGGVSQSPESGGGLTNVASTLLFFLSTASAGYCYRHRDDYDAETIEMQIEELRNHDWITVVSEFDSSAANSTSTVSSLKDLVNLAIDKGDRAVYCYDQELFVFIHDQTEYIYIPPEPPLIADEVDPDNLHTPTPRPYNKSDTDEPFIWEDELTNSNRADKQNGHATNGHSDPSVVPADQSTNTATKAIDDIWIEK